MKISISANSLVVDENTREWLVWLIKASDYIQGRVLNIRFSTRLMGPPFFFWVIPTYRVLLASYPGLPSQLFFAAVEKSVGKAWKQTSRDVCHRWRQMQREGMKWRRKKYTWWFVIPSSSIQSQKSNRKAKLKTIWHLLESDIYRQSLQICSWLGTTVISASVARRPTRAAWTLLANGGHSCFFGFSTTMTRPAHQLYCNECL